MKHLILYPDGRVEGSPEEIMQWEEMQKQKVVNELGKHLNKGEINLFRNVKEKPTNCPNIGHGGCYCSGACMGGGMTFETAYEKAKIMP